MTFRKPPEVVDNAKFAVIAKDLERCRMETFATIDEARARADKLAENQDSELAIVVRVEYATKCERA